jgi:hypothetical protein
MNEQKTKVVFRKWSKAAWSNGDIIALFPEVPADYNGFHCQSYAHIGQHGAADTCIIRARTVPAKPEEYAELKAELERIGYVLEVRTRITSQMHAKRRASA